jgi:hypothetical protein
MLLTGGGDDNEEQQQQQWHEPRHLRFHMCIFFALG